MLLVTADLLDPAHCSHPPRNERYDGVFEDEDGNPELIAITCLCCGASRTRLIAPAVSS